MNLVNIFLCLFCVWILLSFLMSFIRENLKRKNVYVKNINFFSITLIDKLELFLFLINIFDFGGKNILYSALVYMWRISFFMMIFSMLLISGVISAQ